MGALNTGITANDTAKDLNIEYSAAFFKDDVEEGHSGVVRMAKP